MSISSLQRCCKWNACLTPPHLLRIFGSFDTHSKFVLDTLKSICAKFAAFSQSLTIFPSNQSTWRHVKIPAHQHDLAASAPLPKFLLPLAIPPTTQAITKCIDPTSFLGFSPLWRSKSDNPRKRGWIHYESIPGEGRGVLPYMGYIVMCRCEGYGFQTDIQSNLSLLTGTSIIPTPLY